MASVADLKALIPPVKPAPVVDWENIENHLGIRLPADYKALMSEYTSLVIGENLRLSIGNPGHADIETIAEDDIALLSELMLGEDEQIDILDDYGKTVGERYFLPYPEPGGVYPWGSTAYGDILLWEMVGDTPEAWPVWILHGAEAWRHPGGVVDFLVRALNGTLVCPLLQDGGVLDAHVTEFGPGE
ncbi:SMI1/KNR4 family protein [Nonomuraea sp. NPDC049637]|uniref:SMI1/KNR4 family protein n=1 Tax=Nonomuraea sp. NPDC049637 TaxID=3154356 RepID=UPI003430FD75